MSDERIPAADREEPPFVQGLLMRGYANIGLTVRRAIGSVSRRTQVLVWAAGALVIFAAVLVAGIAESPGVIGIVKGIFGGLLCVLFFSVAAAWLVIWAGRPPKKPDTTIGVGTLDTLLAPTLRELDAVRSEVIRKVKARSITRVPIGIAAACALWLAVQGTSDPPGFFELLLWLVVGAVGGEGWAAYKLDREYRRLYKDRVLPRLAARFGDLTYKPASAEDIHKLRALRILEFDRARAEDQIVGSHRGLALSIVEARLESRVGDDTRVTFDGLVIELTLPRSLTGTTVVLTDEGTFGNLKARWRSTSLEPVRLEDPRFEKRFEVYSSHQIEARALLTPAFMERFMALAGRSGFSLPGALAEGNRLHVALPKGLHGDLFEPPAYWQRSGGRALLTLEQDIRAVLSMADTVIDLDFWAAGRKRDGVTAL